MKIKPVQPINSLYKTKNDLYDRLGDNVRCTILDDIVKESDPSSVVVLGSSNIPLFLYNSSGKIT